MPIRPSPRTVPALAALLGALGGLLSSVGSDASGSPPGRSSSGAALSNGWIEADCQRQAISPLDVAIPALAPLDAVRRIASDPQSLPRPRATSGDGLPALTLPISPRPTFLERRESPDGAVVTWKSEAQAHRLDEATGLAWLDPEGDGRHREWSPWSEARPAAGDGTRDVMRRLAARGVGPVHPWRQDPLRRSGPRSHDLWKQDEPPPPPRLSASAIRDVAEDALVVTLDGGESWLRLVLEPVRRANAAVALHEIDATSFFSVGGRGARRLLVAPRPLVPNAAHELLEVRPSGDVVPLGPALVPDAPWSQRVTDVRAGSEGALEAVVLVHDLARDRESRTDSWGAVVRRRPDGTWATLARFALPDARRDVLVRFADATGWELELERDGACARHVPPTLPATR